MGEHLVFTLAAPLASYGSVAVGERRPSWDRPSKSQVVGLVAAALAIERAEETRLRDLTSGLGFAVRVDEPGWLAVDYHTTQAPKEAALRRRAKEIGPVSTRADELACDDLKTILSRREFRTGGHYTIALWRTGDGEPTLTRMVQALTAPGFIPYAGRKAHPLMLPMSPRIIEGVTIEDVFEGYDRSVPEAISDLVRTLGIRPPATRPIYCDASAIPRSQMEGRVARLEERRDIPESRAKWRFGLRSEALLRHTRTRGDTP
jgi:CRISPR system Cascade subunit CasD